MTSTTEQTETAPANATAEPKATKRAHSGARRAHVATKKGKPKKTPKGPKKATARDGSKTSRILDLLKRADGATLHEVVRCTGWKQASVRGFFSGTLGKKMGLKVVSTKNENGERAYSVRP